MREYRHLSLREVADLLALPRETLILCHARPDADAIGSALALKLLLSEMGSPAYCLCESDVPERLRFLSEDVQESVRLSSYTGNIADCRVISVDTASPSQLGELYGAFRDRIVCRIDHHALGVDYADAYVDGGAAATGEILFRLAKLWKEDGKIGDISPRVAALLYAAISSDTGCFKYSNTTGATYLCAAELVTFGIDTAEINRLLFDCKSLKLLRAEAAGLEQTRFYHGGKIAGVLFPYTLKTELELLDEHLETLVDVARAVEGVKVAFAVRQLTEKRVYRISMRSSCEVDVAAVCAAFGGGGHKKAAGCTIEADGMNTVADLLVAEIEKQWRS